MQAKHHFALNLEVVNSELCRLEGACRSDAVLDSHCAELVGEEQLKVRTAFREAKAHMQVGRWCAVLLPICCVKLEVQRSCHPCSMLSFGRSCWT